MVCSTIREILVRTEEEFGQEDAVRYKVGKNEIEAKSYSELRRDSESFSRSLESLEEQGSHIAIIGMTSYTWLCAYFGIVNGGSVAVPLDVSLPAEEACELLDRADVTTLVVDEVRGGSREELALDPGRCGRTRKREVPETEIYDFHAKRDGR